MQQRLKIYFGSGANVWFIEAQPGPHHQIMVASYPAKPTGRQLRQLKKSAYIMCSHLRHGG